jgi:hypothetical protein
MNLVEVLVTESGMIESALDTLRPGLAADGFELHTAPSETADQVQVVLEATREACLDCLVPENILVGIIEDTIVACGVKGVRVKLIKKGFDSPEQ